MLIFEDMQSVLVEVGAIKEKDFRILQKKPSHDETKGNGRLRDCKLRAEDDDDWD